MTAGQQRAQQTQLQQQAGGPQAPPSKCDPNDFACLAMTYQELYKYAVGTTGCIDPPACTKKGRKPAEILYKIFKACNEEAGGDFSKFEACVAEMAGLIDKTARRVLTFK
jgi:hypothetical protein